MSTETAKNCIIRAIEADSRTVFRLEDVAMIVGLSDFSSLNFRMNYAVRTGKLLNPRKGIYAKSKYNFEELASILYTPAYISLEYVLNRSGVISGYQGGITLAGYLSRTVEVAEKKINIRKLKGEILASSIGISQHKGVNIASAERAFLDMLYLEPEYKFENLAILNLKRITDLLPIYNSVTLNSKVAQLFGDSAISRLAGKNKTALQHKFLMIKILKEISCDLSLANSLAVKSASAKAIFKGKERDYDTLEMRLIKPEMQSVMRELIYKRLSDRIIDEAMTSHGPVFMISDVDERSTVHLKILYNIVEGSSFTVKNYLGVPVRVETINKD
ncbi:MAG: hypothetical protein PHD07_08360 [Bacteroidales bacterium]|nr:hypothetical protein [Bacteroidales bacterium]